MQKCTQKYFVCKNNGGHEYNFCVNVTVDKDHHKLVILPLLPAGAPVCVADLTLGTFYPTPHLLLSIYTARNIQRYSLNQEI